MIGVEGMWVIAGDFNAVRCQDEHKNSSFKSACARNFNEFIYDGDLLEYELKGRKFTCVRDNGWKLSKIDRFLVCPNFFNQWPEACLRGLPSSHSDRCPLLLTINKKNYGAKPFRIYNSWMGKSGFKETVEKAAAVQEVGGSVDLKLMKKLNAVRSALKDWRLESSKKEGESVFKAEEELEVLEKIMEERDLSEVEE
ncbi:putative Endonuclease/exonuclease/phosphatase superfamily [Helianthus debilis subsp. tardiflorus]